MQIKARFGFLINSAKVLQKTVEFKDFSRLLSDFRILFKADLIFKDFSRKASKFKYFSLESQPQNPVFRINPENFHPC